MNDAKKTFIEKVKNNIRGKLLIIVEGITPKAITYTLAGWLILSVGFSVWSKANNLCTKPEIQLERVLMMRLLCPIK